MVEKIYAVYTTEDNPFEQMCESLIAQIDNKDTVLKIVFFGESLNNEEYLIYLGILNRSVQSHFTEQAPPISYISQKPFKGMLNAEVMSIPSTENVLIHYGKNYILLENEICRELITGGIIPPDIYAPLALQADAVFEQVGEILAVENFPVSSIIRQWNYIPKIFNVNGKDQNYQSFNDSRSLFYAKTDWSLGYPASTGIGTPSGGIMVELIALTGLALINRPLNNPLQIAAYNYSQGVLVGDFDPCTQKRTTPKFERGRIIGTDESQTILISGTAAIRGELSLIADDIIEQTRITMQNIDYLISPENYPVAETSREYKLLRIYIKNPFQMNEVNTWMNLHHPDTPKIYLCADICRKELLIEIEGVAEIKKHDTKIKSIIPQ